eukprot:31065-Pelagococcus_subviridis.AAC.12
MASSMSYPLYDITATVAFCPAPNLSYPINSIVFVFTIGFCGYTRRYISVSIRFSWLNAMFPIACFPIAHWYVLRGDWLWCGYGMIPAHTPSIVNGSISRCVWSLVISFSYSAMYEMFSSFTSRYSTSPRLRKSLNPHRPALSSSRCSRVASGSPSATIKSGRHTLPPSLAMYRRPPCVVCTLTNSPTFPIRRRYRMSRAKRSGAL